MRFFAMAMTSLLLFGGAALADPQKAELKQPAGQSDSQAHPSAPIVLASAETVRAAPETAPTPIKRRVAPRVTTCRCGDQPATPQPDEQ
ncbi:MAG: hypothetical protein JO335_05995 [Sphingomonas sp.]|nr:hypothetical protein [Sphingomonas sp.]